MNRRVEAQRRQKEEAAKAGVKGLEYGAKGGRPAK
jgi:hypothetical protein